MNFLKLFLLPLLFFSIVSVAGAETMSEDAKIAKLIEYVRNLEEAVFIRNGSEYTAVEAADHLKMKWEKSGGKIKTARQFIDYIATKSILSSKEYEVRFKDGKTVKSKDLLNAELEKIEKSEKK